MGLDFPFEGECCALIESTISCKLHSYKVERTEQLATISLNEISDENEQLNIIPKTNPSRSVIAPLEGIYSPAKPFLHHSQSDVELAAPVKNTSQLNLPPQHTAGSQNSSTGMTGLCRFVLFVLNLCSKYLHKACFKWLPPGTLLIFWYVLLSIK